MDPFSLIIGAVVGAETITVEGGEAADTGEILLGILSLLHLLIRISHTHSGLGGIPHRAHTRPKIHGVQISLHGLQISLITAPQQLIMQVRQLGMTH